MGYSVKYSSFFSYYEQGEYMFQWPKELKEDSCKCLKEILYKNNELLFRVSESDSCTKYLEYNTYFIIFEEGAVLFKLGETMNDTCRGINLNGMYLPVEYVMTGWFQLDKLIAFLCSSEWSVENKEDVITGPELEEIWENSNRRDVFMLNLDGEMRPYSFALSFVDLGMPDVKYYPIELAQDMINIASKLPKTESLDTIFDNKNIFNLTDSDYADFIIERNILKKQGVSLKKLFKNEPQKNSYTWVMKKSDVISKEIKCLEEEKEVNFEMLIQGVNKIKNRL